MADDDHDDDQRLLVQIGSYNTNLQGGAGLPQDLVDWLAPTLQVSTFLAKNRRAPDIVAVGFQELLPLHLGLAGLSRPVIDERDAHIRTQIEAHASNNESYSLVAKAVNVGVALLVYAREDTVTRQVRDVQTRWTGSGPAYMGNKGAVGIRFRVAGRGCKLGEVFTFVCAHLTAHEERLAHRIADYDHIVRTLLFDPSPSHGPRQPTTMYGTSHLFFFGDLNFRVSVPRPRSRTDHRRSSEEALPLLKDDTTRERLREYDQLTQERRKGSVLVGLKEGPFWTFKCTYKYKLNEVDEYDTKRTPSWTDRILYATHTDDPDSLEHSDIDNVLYTSIPSYTTSDHKPVVSMLLLPSPSPASTTTSSGSPRWETGQPPTLRLPATFAPTPDPLADIKRYTGRVLDRIVGYAWSLLVLIGVGSTVVGVFNCFFGYAAWSWWKKASSSTVEVA